MAKFINLQQIFLALSRGAVIQINEIAADVLHELTYYGIQILDKTVSLPEEVELLDKSFIEDSISQLHWIKRFEVESFVESTNTTLVNRALEQSIDGHVLTAEAQFGGRGRRGRSWKSPFARNLAISIGMKLHRSAVEIGSFSLVVGVAVVDVLREAGVQELSLKWPNDVLLGRRKVCGILIELVPSEKSFEVVIGVGVNIGAQPLISGAVDQEVADVYEQVPDMSRNKLAASLLKKIVQYGREFSTRGFLPFRNRWEQLNEFQGREVSISMPKETILGKCVGVNEVGCLLVDEGSCVREIYAGEVSLRGAGK